MRYEKQPYFQGDMIRRPNVLVWFSAWLLLLPATVAVVHGEVKQATFTAKDTLAIERDSSADAQSMLDDLAWQPAPFEVTAQAARGDEDFDALIYFASPRPRGDDIGRPGILLGAHTDVKVQTQRLRHLVTKEGSETFTTDTAHHLTDKPAERQGVVAVLCARLPPWLLSR